MIFGKSNQLILKRIGMRAYSLNFVVFFCLGFYGCGTLHHEFMRTSADANSSSIRVEDTGSCRNNLGFQMEEVFVISHINGRPVDEILTRVFGMEQRKGISSVWLKPGVYTLQLRYFCWGAYANPVIWFDAKPGASYIIRYDTNGYNINAWAEDASTGKLVGGYGGSPESFMDP